MRPFLLVLLVIVALVLIVSVLLQPSKADGFRGFMTGNSDTFYSKNKSRTRESFLYKVTIVSAIFFAVLTLAINMIQ
jgi:preprotein translocase subunit SecG